MVSHSQVWKITGMLANAKGYRSIYALYLTVAFGDMGVSRMWRCGEWERLPLVSGGVACTSLHTHRNRFCFEFLVLWRSNKSGKRVIITWMSLRYFTSNWLTVTESVISDDLFTSWSLNEIYQWRPLHPNPKDPEIFPSRLKLDPQMTRICKFSPRNGRILAWRAPVKQFGVVACKILMWSLLCITDESWWVKNKGNFTLKSFKILSTDVQDLWWMKRMVSC
jgi:hypothetical protein